MTRLQFGIRVACPDCCSVCDILSSRNVLFYCPSSHRSRSLQLFGHEVVSVLCGLAWGLWGGFGIVAAGTFLGEVGNF
jgi:hypothetical protein